MIYHSHSSLLSASLSFLSYGTCCFYNSWQKLSLPWLPSLSLFHILLLNCAHIVPWKPPFQYAPFAEEIAISLHLIYYFVVSKTYINHFTQKIQTVDRTAALLHLALLQTNPPLRANTWFHWYSTTCSSDYNTEIIFYTYYRIIDQFVVFFHST